MTKQSESKWYVYTLVDPRDGQVFYVGKGCRGRIHQHEKDAANPNAVCSKKINKIKELWDAGCEVQKGFHAFFWDEQAAYDCETDLIEEIGLDSLTNLLPGGQKAWERRRQERATRKRAEKPAEPLHVWLAKDDARTSTLYERMADWVKAGMHKNGMKLKVTASNPAYRINAMITEAIYNSLLPSIWKQICEDNRTHGVVRERLRPYGIEVV